jgi:hypothetical protein
LRAEGFEHPRFQSVAAAILGDTREWKDRLDGISADAELTEVVSGLLVVEKGPPLTEAQVSGAIERLQLRNKKRKYKELNRLIVQGLISRDDERYREYLQLVNDLGGQGLKGEGESASRSNEGESGSHPPA